MKRAAILAALLALAGCATAPTSPTTPTAGARCVLQLHGRAVPVQVVGPAYGLVDVRPPEPLPPMLWVHPTELVCGGWS